MSTIDTELVERFTGQRRVITVEAAVAELNAANDEHERSLARLQRTEIELPRAKVAQLFYHAWLWLATLPTRENVAAWSIVLAACGSSSLAISAALVLIFGARLEVVLVLGLSPFFGFALLPNLFPKEVRTIAFAAAQAKERVAELKCESVEARTAWQDSVRCQAQARRVYEGLLRARGSLQNHLLSADLSGMSGPAFEQFLEEAFVLNGYTVRRTGQSGDQGVDLIISRNGPRIAIQAKRYNNPVSNDAVQQVYLGMRIHECQKCAVVTTSSFTPGAKIAAKAAGCLLVEGRDIPEIVRGKGVV